MEVHPLPYAAFPHGKALPILIVIFSVMGEFLNIAFLIFGGIPK
jgi:hypothetical protein